MRAFLAGLIVLGVVSAAQGDPDHERARQLSPESLQRILDGYGAYERGDYVGAVVAWGPIAPDLPHGVQYLVASMLAEGRGSEDDAAAAAEILHEAATHGHAEGQYLLGLALRVAGDGASAVRWLSAAAENQYAAALFALGRLYEAGDGVEKDLLEAYVHYGRAAQQGQPEGLERGNAVWPRLTPLQQDAAWERLRAPAP